MKVRVHYLGFIRNMLKKRKDVKTGFVVTVNGVLMGQLHGVDTRLNGGQRHPYDIHGRRIAGRPTQRL